jgi:hypothetical protein
MLLVGTVVVMLPAKRADKLLRFPLYEKTRMHRPNYRWGQLIQCAPTALKNDPTPERCQ